MVLVGGYRDEGCLWEDVGAEGCVFGAEGIVLISFYDVKSWLVLVHRVEDNLEEETSL